MVRLDLLDGSIDGIVSFYSIIHTPKQHMHFLFREFNRVLKKGGKILVVVKKGETEGYRDEVVRAKTSLYFADFNEGEVKSFMETNGFKVILLETRQPYDFEISVERIYAIGRKITHA